MKKIFVILIAVLTVFTLASCKNEPAHEHTWDAGTDNGNGKMEYECTECHETYSTYKTYSIGDNGPAGGKVFYDCDADNDTGNADGLKSSECGWRYLEVASEDLGPCVFGYFRESDAASNKEIGTSQNIGTGKANTEALVAAMGNEAYSASSGSAKTADYAAKVCADYSAGGKDDWFLPSVTEVNRIYINKAAIGGFSDDVWYLTSSEQETYVWRQHFGGSGQNSAPRSEAYKIRPVRAF